MKSNIIETGRAKLIRTYTDFTGKEPDEVVLHVIGFSAERVDKGEKFTWENSKGKEWGVSLRFIDA